MIPIIPILVVAGFGALVAACSSNDEQRVNDDQDAGTDGGVELDASIDAAPDADVDSGIDAGEDAGPPPTPSAPSASKYSDAPCAFPASITYDQNKLFLTCGGVQNGLFSSQLGSGTWELIGSVSGFPSNHIKLDNQHYAVAHSNGITIIKEQDGSVTDSIDFSMLNPKDELDQPLNFTLNNPAGMALIGGKLFIATSNLDHIDPDPTLTTFHKGTVLYLDYNTNNGTLDEGSARVLSTSRKNPTALKQTDTNKFAVLNSGDYVPSPENASLDIFDTQTHNCMTTDLEDVESVTAQASPVMPLNDCGHLLIGIQKPTAALKSVSKTTGSVVIDFDIPGVQGFISNISKYKNVAIMSDFGIFGQGGAILYKHSYPPEGWMGVPITQIPQGSAGPSVVVGDTLYLAVTDNTGMGGSIWKADLSDMD